MIKVCRCTTPPASLAIEKLKVSGSYKCEDVIQQLRYDFNDKCYLCEIKNLTDPEVEHLLPHENGKYIDRKFDWNNLFWSCRHCNGVKNRERYNKDVIDCCIVDPKLKISHRYEDGKVQVKALDADIASINTAQLIEDCFELRNSGIREAACDARVKSLQSTMAILYNNLLSYEKNKNEYVKHKIISLIKDDAHLASFTQQYIRDHINAYEYLREYI